MDALEISKHTLSVLKGDAKELFEKIYKKINDAYLKKKDACEAAKKAAELAGTKWDFAKRLCDLIPKVALGNSAMVSEKCVVKIYFKKLAYDAKITLKNNLCMVEGLVGLTAGRVTEVIYWSGYYGVKAA